MADLPKLHGFSLSFCIQDIITGKVDEDQVVRITAGTMARTPADWMNLSTLYAKGAWRKDPERAVEILGRLLDSGRIEQPRVFGEEARNIAAGHWEEVPFFEVGKTYRTLEGELVKIVAENNRRGYETVQGDDSGPDGTLGWRYNRLGDLGRPTGSPTGSPSSLVPGSVD